MWFNEQQRILNSGYRLNLTRPAKRSLATEDECLVCSTLQESCLGGMNDCCLGPMSCMVAAKALLAGIQAVGRRGVGQAHVHASRLAGPA
jgi:hypothetical protein